MRLSVQLVSQVVVFFFFFFLRLAFTILACTAETTRLFSCKKREPIDRRQLFSSSIQVRQTEPWLTSVLNQQLQHTYPNLVLPSKYRPSGIILVSNTLNATGQFLYLFRKNHCDWPTRIGRSFHERQCGDKPSFSVQRNRFDGRITQYPHLICLWGCCYCSQQRLRISAKKSLRVELFLKEEALSSLIYIYIYIYFFFSRRISISSPWKHAASVHAV